MHQRRSGEEIMTGTIDPAIVNLVVFVLAVFVGYHVIWNVTPALHTPLMSVTNAISSVIIVGAIGGTIGAFVAKRVQMTQMPQLVAAMHSLVGMAAVLIAIAVVNNPAAFGEHDPLPRGNRFELFIGSFVGAITFSGSVIAFGKL